MNSEVSVSEWVIWLATESPLSSSATQPETELCIQILHVVSQKNEFILTLTYPEKELSIRVLSFSITWLVRKSSYF
jgi:hypothetical protein